MRSGGPDRGRRSRIRTRPSVTEVASMPSSRRFLILAEGKFGPMSSKTANAFIRYAPQETVAVLDSTCTARTVGDVLGFGGEIPVVATFGEGMALAPNALLIGIAP